MHPVSSVSAAAARYRNVQVSTANPAQIVVMLYDGVARFTGEAAEAMGRRDRARAGERIGRALAIVEELAATVDPSHAPELADNLLAVYGFCCRRLVEANLQQSAEALAEVVQAIAPLREAWAEVASRHK